MTNDTTQDRIEVLAADNAMLRAKLDSTLDQLSREKDLRRAETVRLRGQITAVMQAAGLAPGTGVDDLRHQVAEDRRHAGIFRDLVEVIKRNDSLQQLLERLA